MCPTRAHRPSLRDRDDQFRNDLEKADVIAEAHNAGQLALIPLADTPGVVAHNESL
jgi:hypothetical protein